MTADLFREIVEETSCWIAICNDRNVIGFCWGYPVMLTDLEEKLGLTVKHGLARHLGHPPEVAYQDEVGVIPEYRGQKIAKTMVKYRLDDFLEQGLGVGVVRTREAPEPSDTFLWYKKVGYVTIARYPNGDGRVILARSFVGLPELL